MAFSNRLEKETFIVSGDHSGLQFHIVELLDAHKCGAAVANVGMGILQNKPQDAEHGTVALFGTSKCKAGAAISVGDYITSGGSGWAAVVGSGTAADKKVIGRAVSAAASGSVFSVELDRFLVVRTGGLA